MLKYRYLYHGSSKLIKDIIYPNPSKVLDGDSRVFSTQSKGFALMFMGKRWKDKDIELGSHSEKHILYAIERKPGMFQKVFAHKTGYLYKLKSAQFHTDKRLGMQYHEFISDEPVKIIKTIVVKDVYQELRKSDILLFTFDKIKFIYFNKRKYNSDIIDKEDFDIPDLKNIIANIKSYKKKNIVVNSNINYANIWKYVYNSNKTTEMNKIGLVEIRKNDYTFIIY